MTEQIVDDPKPSTGECIKTCLELYSPQKLRITTTNANSSPVNLSSGSSLERCQEPERLFDPKKTYLLTDPASAASYPLQSILLPAPPKATQSVYSSESYIQNSVPSNWRNIPQNQQFNSTGNIFQGSSNEGSSFDPNFPISELLPRVTHVETANDDTKSNVLTEVARKKERHKRKCEICLKEVRNLEDHVNTHTGEKPHKCNICEKSFAAKCALKVHLGYHMDDKDRLHQCNICHRGFPHLQNLQYHMTSHTKEKPYNCDQCEKSYSRLSHLQSHQRTHTGDLFPCDKCSLKFTRKYHLDRHLLTHVEGLPYKCDKCESSFKTERYLKRHLTKHDSSSSFKKRIL